MQIDYSLSEYTDNEDAYHMMPLLSYTKFALHNFIEWTGVKHFTEFIEDLPEFHGYPLWRLPHLVSSLTAQYLHTIFQYSKICILTKLILHGPSFIPSTAFKFVK